ncbi:MAG: fibronectin type III domain-containing protein, partial [Myxococcales bacterium]
GNLTAVYLDTITLDTTAPTAQSFAALQNPTRFAQVDLSLLAHGATRMCVKGSIQGSCDHDSVPPSSWEVYSTSKSVTLAGAEGDKPLSVRFADEAGNLSGTLGTSVRYDITAPIPGAPAVLVKGWRVDPAGGADLEDLEVSYTAEVMVELRADGATRVAVSNTELDCNAADYQSLAFSGGRATLHHLLANGTGTRRVRACFADEAGNVTSAALTGEIYLDQQAPAVVGFSIADGARWTRQTTVDLTEIDTVDDFPQPGFMRLMNCDSGNLSSCFWGAWMPMADSYTGWPLDGADGLKRVYLQVRDRAGNVALAPAAATIELDSLAPTTPGAPVVMPQSREATLSWAAGVDANLSEYRIDYSQDASFASGVATVSVPSSMTTAVITGLLNRVPYHFRVRALDAAGNSSGYSPSASGALGLSPMVFDPSHGPVDEWSGSPYGGPRMHYFDGELFVYGLDEGEAGRQFAIRRCRVSEEDCRAASSWSMHSFSTIPDGSGIPGSGNPYVITGSYSFVATRKSYYVSFIHSDSEGNQIILATCDRAAPGGCFGPGAEWTHRMMTSGTMQEAEGGPRLAYNGARVYLAYVRNGESLRVPFVTSCSEAKSDCATAVWASEAPFSQQVDYYNPELSLTATDERVWMAFSDANGDIRIGVCRVGTGCDENPTAVWPQYTLSKVANPTRWPQLAFSGRYLYLAWAEAFSQKMRRCPVSTGCDLATDWEPIPAGDFVASTGGVPPFSLVAAEGVLHAAWHQRSSGEVHYGSCIDPDGRDCARRGNWDSFVVERFVSQATWPGLASYGPNLALSYHDNLRRLKVIQPLIATPTVFAAAPGVGEVRAAWSATPSVDGFQQLLGSGPGTWDSQIVVPDSLATTSAVAVGPDEEMLTTLRPFRGGQLGDDALPRRVRPFQHGTVFAGAPVSYAVATNSNRIFAAYAQGTSLYLRHCNTALDCSLPASWSAAVLIYNSLHATDPGFQLVATDEKLYLVYANSASSAMYFGRCDLATGCDQPEDFSALQLLPSGGGRAPALAVADDGRLVIAANDLNTLRVFVCDDRVDCRVLGNWTVRLQISGVF